MITLFFACGPSGGTDGPRAVRRIDAGPIQPRLEVALSPASDAAVRIVLPDMGAATPVTLTFQTPAGDDWRRVERTFTPSPDLQVPGGYALTLTVPLASDSPVPPPRGQWSVIADVTGVPAPLGATFMLPP